MANGYWRGFRFEVVLIGEGLIGEMIALEVARIISAAAVTSNPDFHT